MVELQQKLREVARKFREKPIKLAYYFLENGIHRVYITYADKTEASVKFKTREGAEAFIPLLYEKPLPCRVCGNQPTNLSGMISCGRCSIHAGTEAIWNQLMTDTPPVRKLLAETRACLEVCTDVIMMAEEQFLVTKAVKTLTNIKKLDLSPYFAEAKDARAEEERLRRGS